MMSRLSRQMLERILPYWCDPEIASGVHFVSGLVSRANDVMQGKSARAADIRLSI
jgi:hypothetical protein